MRRGERLTSKSKFTLFVILFATTSLAQAAPRTSASYSITIETVDSGGANAQSANYSLRGNATGESGAGNSNVITSANYTGKIAYVGQLYDIVGLAITAPPSNSLNESSTRQLSAAPLADDGTTTAALSPSTVSWSVVSGPITSISTSGLATAGMVYQDTAAVVGGNGQGLTGQSGLTILNVNTDDFGAYANDGIDDSWQVQYFGQPPNALAGPNADADGTGQTNLFKFVAGLNPLDHSRFSLSVLPVSGQSGQKNLVFQPVVSGRTYAVQFATSLTSQNWQTLTGSSQSDNGATRTVTDPNASSPKDYRVQVTKP